MAEILSKKSLKGSSYKEILETKADSDLKGEEVLPKIGSQRSISIDSKRKVDWFDNHRSTSKRSINGDFIPPQFANPPISLSQMKVPPI